MQVFLINPEIVQALMELNDTLVSERKKEVFEFSRDVVVGAENPRFASSTKCNV